jgi:hypothetical protein
LQVWLLNTAQEMHVFLCSSCCDGVVKLYGRTLQQNDGGDKVLGGAMVGGGLTRTMIGTE